MTSAFSWQNCVSLCPASFCTPRSNLPVTPGVFWLPTFAFQSPIMKRTSFLGSRRSCRSSQNRSASASLALLVGAYFWITVILNGLPWKWTFSLFWDCIQVLHFGLLLTMRSVCISGSNPSLCYCGNLLSEILIPKLSE